jgi:hypothetical protein
VRRPALALAALALVAAALPASASAERCRDVIDTGPTGFDPADSNAIRTEDVGCKLARSLAHKAGRIAVRQRVELRGFDCRHLGSTPRGFFRQRCTQGERRVGWVLGNAERRCPGTVFIADPGITVRYWVQGLSCRRGRHVLVHSDPFPPGWRGIGRDPFDGRRHVARNNPRKRIAYR